MKVFKNKTEFNKDWRSQLAQLQKSECILNWDSGLTNYYEDSFFRSTFHVTSVQLKGPISYYVQGGGGGGTIF